MQNIFKTVFLVVYILYYVQDCSAARLINGVKPSIKVPAEQNRSQNIWWMFLNKITGLNTNQGRDDSAADHIISAYNLLEKGKADISRNEHVSGRKELTKVEKSKQESRYDDTFEKTGVDRHSKEWEERGYIFSKNIPKKQVKRSTKSNKSTENENADSQKEQMPEKSVKAFGTGRKLFGDK